MRAYCFRRLAGLWFPLTIAATHPVASQQSPPTQLRLVSGVTPSGQATDLWLAILRKRLPTLQFDSAARIQKPLTREESAWVRLFQAHLSQWERFVPDLAPPYAPAAPPDTALIVLGNRGADDAFTHDSVTIGFDLAALQSNYGDAELAKNGDLVDRLFRHEFVHLLQKAWRPSHPWPATSPLRAALADIWTEGLGNYYSLSASWLTQDGRPAPAAAQALADLEPRFVTRLAALTCAAPEAERPLLTNLSSGPFARKWGAVPAALWLKAEPGPPDVALRRFIQAGPAGVWELADHHLPAPLRTVLREARATDSLCTTH